MQEHYFVYILQCNDGFYYVGLTNDFIKDFIAHNEGNYEFTNIRTPA